jgi:hypothetical protein
MEKIYGIVDTWQNEFDNSICEAVLPDRISTDKNLLESLLMDDYFEEAYSHYYNEIQCWPTKDANEEWRVKRWIKDWAFSNYNNYIIKELNII